MRFASNLTLVLITLNLTCISSIPLYLLFLPVVILFILKLAVVYCNEFLNSEPLFELIKLVVFDIIDNF
jgi:hypothetical protein